MRKYFHPVLMLLSGVVIGLLISLLPSVNLSKSDGKWATVNLNLSDEIQTRDLSIVLDESGKEKIFWDKKYGFRFRYPRDQWVERIVTVDARDNVPRVYVELIGTGKNSSRIYISADDGIAAGGVDGAETISDQKLQLGDVTWTILHTRYAKDPLGLSGGIIGYRDEESVGAYATIGGVNYQLSISFSSQDSKKSRERLLDILNTVEFLK